ncbi:MAG TPA: hypothetical protein VFL59_02740 [Candidatus Nanopelagicales bacterium]|nr:hypothetical protein [Candidatus Nanopelagicales bacterium]
MGTATALLVIVWLAVAAAVTVWALRARREVDLRAGDAATPPETFELRELSDVPQPRAGDRPGPATP